MNDETHCKIVESQLDIRG